MSRLWSAAIILLAVAVSAGWALLVPVFQEPDESNHFDYALVLWSARRPIFASEAPAASEVHPYTRHLSKFTHARSMRLNAAGRVPRGYGSRDFFAELDRSAPLVRAADFAPGKLERLPFYARSYPPVFYMAVASVMGMVSIVAPRSPTLLFFAARLFCVALLGVSLSMTALTLEAMRIPPRTRLGIIAAIGLFPLTSWVSAYVQPDNLAFALISAILYVSLRYGRDWRNVRLAAVLGCLFALLVGTKLHYAAAIGFSLVILFAALFAALRNERRWIAAGALATLVPGAVMYALVRPLLASGEAGGLCPPVASVFDAKLHQGVFATLRFAAPIAVQTIGSMFFWSNLMRSYWNDFTWGGYPITFQSVAFTRLTTIWIRYLTLGAVVLVLARILIDGWRLSRIARQGHVRSALLVLARRTTFVSYVAFIAIICGFAVYAGGDFALQGRYFLPLIAAALLCATVWGPAVLPKGPGAAASGLLLTAMVLYGLAGSYFGYRTVYQRFYSKPPSQAPVDIWARFDDSAGKMQTRPIEDLGLVKGGSRLRLSGYAFDGRSLDPWAGIGLLVDGTREVPGGYGLSRPDVVCLETDSDLVATGFSASIDTSRMSAGTHTAALVARTRTGQLIPTDAQAVFSVSPTGRPTSNK